MEKPHVARVILYVRDLPNVAAFYQNYFGLVPLPSVQDGWLELAPQSGGCHIAMHQASSAQERSLEIKIVFGVRGVRRFATECAARGLTFGVVHEVNGFQFSNARDPAGNSIQISSGGLT